MFQRRVETDLLPHTDRESVGVIAFCPLDQGKLTNRYLDGLPADSRMARNPSRGQGWYDKQKADGVWDKVASLNEVAQSRGQTMAQLALTWTMRDPRVTSVLIGVSKVEQLADNIAVAQAPPLTAEELAKIDRILEG
jgi:L-glyceraldehyde 3-phosphate reductase